MVSTNTVAWDRACSQDFQAEYGEQAALDGGRQAGQDVPKAQSPYGTVGPGIRAR